jgi:hypothetical protein
MEVYCSIHPFAIDDTGYNGLKGTILTPLFFSHKPINATPFVFYLLYRGRNKECFFLRAGTMHIGVKKNLHTVLYLVVSKPLNTLSTNDQRCTTWAVAIAIMILYPRK